MALHPSATDYMLTLKLGLTYNSNHFRLGKGRRRVIFVQFFQSLT